MEYKHIVTAMDRELDARQNRLTTTGLFAAGVAFSLLASHPPWWLVYLALLTTFALEVLLLSQVANYRFDLCLQNLNTVEEKWLSKLEKQRFSFWNRLKRYSFFLIGWLLLLIATIIATDGAA